MLSAFFASTLFLTLYLLLSTNKKVGVNLELLIAASRTCSKYSTESLLPMKGDLMKTSEFIL